MPNLSVIVIAKNEQDNIGRCLQSVAWADEIIVLDSGSTDNTIKIANEFTNKVFSTDWQGYGIQKQRALDHATCEWVLSLDADESVTPALKKELLLAIQNQQADAFRIPILLNFYGKQLNYSGCYRQHIRLFRRAGAYYTKKLVHEEVLLPAASNVFKLKAPIYHHSFRDVSHALQKINQYSSTTAQIRAGENRSSSILKAIGSSMLMFLRCYFLQFGFLEGQRGLLIAILNAHGSFYRHTKMIYRDNH